MKLKDFRTGYVVKTNESTYLVTKLEYKGKEQYILFGKDGFIPLSDYDENFKVNEILKETYRQLKIDDSKYDIIEVYDMRNTYGLGFKITNNTKLNNLIWKRN